MRYSQTIDNAEENLTNLIISVERNNLYTRIGEKFSVTKTFINNYNLTEINDKEIIVPFIKYFIDLSSLNIDYNNSNIFNL